VTRDQAFEEEEAVVLDLKGSCGGVRGPKGCRQRRKQCCSCQLSFFLQPTPHIWCRWIHIHYFHVFTLRIWVIVSRLSPPAMDLLSSRLSFFVTARALSKTGKTASPLRCPQRSQRKRCSAGQYHQRHNCCTAHVSLALVCTWTGLTLGGALFY
jgi:hypothetical protein